MDYFSVIVLVIITFIFITDRKIKSIEEIKKQNENIIGNINNIKQNMIIVKFDFEKISYKRLQNIFNNNKFKYVFLENKMLKLKNSEREILIANFANNKEKISGFNLKYDTKIKKKICFKKMYLNIINYLNIFNRNDLTTYGVVILNTKDINNLVPHGSKVICQNIVSYIRSKNLNLAIDIDSLMIDNKVSYMIKKIYNGNYKIVFKFLFLVITSYFVTSNLLISIFNTSKNFSNILTSIVVYFCYTYILKYIYEPIGKSKWVASYMFFIYFLAYPFVLLYIQFLDDKKNTIFK